MADETKAPEVPGSAEGLGGPNPTPTFGNKPQEDNNAPIEQQSELDSFKEGAEAATEDNAAAFQVTPEILAAANAGEAQDDTTQYASPNIARLRIGTYEFENGRLSVPNDKVEEFEKLLKSADFQTQNAVHKIDRQGGEAVARRFLEQNQGKLNRGTTTSASTPAAPVPGEQKHVA